MKHATQKRQATLEEVKINRSPSQPNSTTATCAGRLNIAETVELGDRSVERLDPQFIEWKASRTQREVGTASQVHHMTDDRCQ
jgi:hypothetical protein